MVRKNRQNLVAYLILAAAVGLLLVVAIYQLFFARPSQTIESNQASSSSAPAPQPSKGDSTHSPATPSNTTPPPNDLPSKQPDTPQPSPTLGVVISRSGQAGQGQPLVVHTNVTGTTSGSCEMTFDKAGQPSFTKSFPVVFEATSATCSNASIATSNFTADGDWQLSVVVKSGDQTSAKATQTVTVAR